MPFTIATWNINSVRLRIGLVERFLAEYAPDVLCLQETKCPDDLFPHNNFHAAGYEVVGVSGQKGYHGVAVVSRRPFEVVERRRFCSKDDCRHMSVRVQAGAKSLLVHNFYVPAGGDEPNPDVNPKFRHKLDFIEEMREVPAEHGADSGSILVGDLNVAPHPNDVWSHKQMLGVVSHTPVETEGLESMRKAGQWVDLMRHGVSDDEKLYTWWSYRAADWLASNRGRRLDHVWGSPGMESHLTGIRMLKDLRGWERPSDHVPVLATFDLD
jgi:exodeoxyribonuclease III